MSLPYGMDPSELKPGSMRSMTSDKLASFSLGGTKKTAFQKHKEMLEAKRKQQEDATAVEMAKWVEEFEGGGDNQKQFVRGGVIQQGETADRSGGGAGSSSRGGAPPSRQPPMLQRPPQRRSAPSAGRAPSAGARAMFSQPADDIDGEAIDGDEVDGVPLSATVRVRIWIFKCAQLRLAHTHTHTHIEPEFAHRGCACTSRLRLLIETALANSQLCLRIRLCLRTGLRFHPLRLHPRPPPSTSLKKGRVYRVPLTPREGSVH